MDVSKPVSSKSLIWYVIRLVLLNFYFWVHKIFWEKHLRSCEESRVKHKKITNFNLKRFWEIDKSYYLPRIIIFFEKKMLCSFQMNGNTLNVEKLESRVKELTPDDFTGDVHEIIEQCVNQGTSRSDQSYVLNLYVHNAYFTPCVFFSVH